MRETRAAAGRPLLFAADLERGAGQQFDGATSLPPAGAIASLDDLEVTCRAGFVTGREARALGIDWVFAPVADLDVEPRNPIVGTRSFGPDPGRVAEHVAAWIRGCRDAGALACAKHFPGHGRTVQDSHLEPATARMDRRTLAADLLPFRAAVRAGVDSLMTAHVAYPALDPSGAVATLSAPILDTLLRGELRFAGAVVSDALRMEGLAPGGPDGAAVAALNAGCDLLLDPEDPAAVARELVEARARGRLTDARIDDALRRRGRLVRRAGVAAGAGLAIGHGGDGPDAEWAMAIAVRTIRVLRGPRRLPPRVRLEVVDDDVGGPHPPPSRASLGEALRAAGLLLAPDGIPLVALFADTRGWKGRAGLSARAAERVREICVASPEALVVIFGHPRLADEVPAARSVVCAWGGEPLMQVAAVRALTSS